MQSPAAVCGWHAVCTLPYPMAAPSTHLRHEYLLVPVSVFFIMHSRARLGASSHCCTDLHKVKPLLPPLASGLARCTLTCALFPRCLLCGRQLRPALTLDTACIHPTAATATQPNQQTLSTKRIITRLIRSTICTAPIHPPTPRAFGLGARHPALLAGPSQASLPQPRSFRQLLGTWPARCLWHCPSAAAATLLLSSASLCAPCLPGRVPAGPAMCMRRCAAHRAPPRACSAAQVCHWPMLPRHGG